MREEVIDRYGNVIYLTDERWHHIVDRHYELNGHRPEIISAIRSGKRRRDPEDPDTFYYKKRLRHPIANLNYIEAVVVFQWRKDKPNNFIVTAYPK